MLTGNLNPHGICTEQARQCTSGLLQTPDGAIACP